VLRDIDLDLYRGEKICLVGVNGAGKTTLTRLIAQELTPQRGSVQVGERVTIGYYAQHQVDALNLDATVYAEVLSTVADSQAPRVRDVLGMFQLSGDAIYKKISVLSGGEKARVSLTKILLSPVNFLIMDEPTNHLDKVSKEALEHALMHYDGTLLLISHDRYFLDKIVSRVVELKNTHITEYLGNYTDYLQKRGEEIRNEELGIKNQEIQNRKQKTENGGQDGSQSSGKKTKEQRRLEAEARQTISKDRNRVKQTIESLEVQIERCESKKEELEFLMALPETYQDSEKVVVVQKEYAALKKDLEESYHRWEAAQLALEEIVNRIEGKI
jgi:ATP-binding cassette subfamily F protein 3